jgi:hypothetical protein
MSIFIPQTIQVLIFKNKKNKIQQGVVLYNENKYITIVVQNVIILKSVNILMINKSNYVNYRYSTDTLTTYIYLWDLFFIKKIKFKGKGYKI